jgi:large subunit ribosomal protein L4e
MKMAKVYDTKGNQSGEAKLPKIFNTPVKPKVIKRAVLAIQANTRQPYGTNPLAGKRSSAHYHASRHYRFTMMNREMARISRIHGKVGYMANRARIVPQAVKGRRAHPPKADKKWDLKVNKKEKKLAIKSALAATAKIELVKKRGHRVNEAPIIFMDDFENISKTKEVSELLGKLIKEEMERCSIKKVRAGKGKMRGRKYVSKKGPLLVVSKKCNVLKAAGNIPGVDIATVSQINAELLAPGTHAGRFTVFTQAALDELEKKFGE